MGIPPQFHCQNNGLVLASRQSGWLNYQSPGKWDPRAKENTDYLIQGEREIFLATASIAYSDMDHLALSAASNQSQVPLLCTINPDSREPFFTDYPESRGWIIGTTRAEGIKRPDGAAPKPVQITAFLQEWTYFGLLKEVFKIAGVEAKLRDFVGLDSAGKTIVTSYALPGYLDQWAAKQKECDMDKRIQRQQSLAFRLKVVQLFFETHINSVFSTLHIDRNVHISILVLAETLRNAAMYIWKLPETSEYPLRRITFRRGENMFADQLLKAGRCISETELLRTGLDNTGLYIAALMEWPQLGIKRSHQKCTKEICVAEQVDDATYMTAHTAECADQNLCQFSAPDVQAVARILRNGDIPIIRITEKRGRGTVDLEVVSGLPYMAFSHVWAHGLGNTKRNALPRCQLLRLKKHSISLFRRLNIRQKPAIWIDTLCIPVDPAMTDLRKLAIAQIAKTFKEAKQVLVLDMELEEFPSANVSRNEISTRILCSGWMRRLWTLQEAVLTESGPGFEKMYVQFKDTAVSVQGFLGKKEILSLYYSEKGFQQLVTTFPRAGSAVTDLYSLTTALRRRSTSKLSDEAICLASILGLNIGQVVRAGNMGESRMKAFYEQIPEIPQHILFHRTACLAIDGYRWAPKSFIGTQYLDFDFHLPNSEVVGKRDDKGFHVRFPGFILTGMTRPRTNTEHFSFTDPTEPGKAYHLTPESLGIQLLPSTPPEIYQKEFARWIAFDRAVYESKELGVLWREQGNCVLVRVTEEALDKDGDGNSEIYGLYLFRGFLRVVRSAISSSIISQKKPVSQRWCVG